MQLWTESGLVEVTTALLLAALALLLLWQAVRAPHLWHLPVIAALLCMRELDLDKAVEPGLLKSRTYTGDAPLAVKLLGLLVVGLALWSLWRLVRHGWAPFRAAWAEGRAWPGLLVAAVAMVVVAKAIDGLNRKLEPFGVQVSDRTEAFAVKAEEVMELGFAALLVVAAVSVLRRPSRSVD